jgi:hypothetical protein
MPAKMEEKRVTDPGEAMRMVSFISSIFEAHTGI